MPRILVVGGAGYIGSQMVLSLLDHGWETVVLDNLSMGHRELIPSGAAFIPGDLADAALLDRLFAEQQIDGVMHFAAFAFVGESVTEPAKYYRNNVANTLNLLEAMRKHGVQRFVFSSTCAIFGEPVQVPMAEEHPQSPINPYGRSKQMVERILADFDAAYGLRSVCLRYFNAAGADPQGRSGEWHDPETHLIPLVLQTALSLRPSISVFGRDYATPDGTCIRDYVHVADLCQAHLRAMEYLVDGGASRAFNLGNGQGHSVQQVLDAARRATGIDFPVLDAPRRPGDPARLVSDSQQALQELHWRPQYPDLETILQHAWTWEQKLRQRQ